MITIESVSKQNANEIYKFENENRAFFESTLPSRGDDYYVIDNFDNIIGLICKEQKAEILYMNIIRNASNEMVGRINLFPIQMEPYNRAFELGYRIGETHQGNGYASEAVRLLIQLALDTYGIDYIQALTSPNNFASQNILIKNGFVFIKRIPNDVEVNGAFEDSIVFERVRQEPMKIAFLDRDGTIVSDYPDEAWKGRIIPEILDGALEGMKRLNQLGFEIIIVTNQYIINDGIITTAEYEQFTQNMKSIFDKNNVKVLDIFHCPHSSREKCKCKKPLTGMIESALAKYPSIELTKSIMIGDSESDQLLASNMNLKFYTVDSSKSDGMNGVYRSIEDIIELGNIDE